MKKFILFVVCLLILLPSAVAHPGKTDKNGGHLDYSIGEYHYHHGYPAHQHTDGVCLYEFDDQTGATSGSTSGTTDSEPADSLQEVSNDNTSNEQNNDTVERGDYGPEAETEFETKRDAYISGFENGLEYSYDTHIKGNAYNDGYEEGYKEGERWGYEDGIADGVQKGYDEGYSYGYNQGSEGVSKGTEYNETLSEKQSKDEDTQQEQSITAQGNNNADDNEAFAIIYPFLIVIVDYIILVVGANAIDLIYKKIKKHISQIHK